MGNDIKKIQGELFSWKCPNCPKVITGTTEKQVEFNRRSHEIICTGDKSAKQPEKAEA